jgi:hypothetical protein
VKRYPCERITWRDHCEASGGAWCAPADWAKAKPVIVVSIGWTVRETKTFLVSVPQIASNGYTGQPLVIVKSCITKRQRIEES